MTNLTLTITYGDGDRRTYSVTVNKWDLTTDDMIMQVFRPVLMAAEMPGAERLGLVDEEDE
jgi:hypothetical protein